MCQRVAIAATPATNPTPRDFTRLHIFPNTNILPAKHRSVAKKRTVWQDRKTQSSRTIFCLPEDIAALSFRRVGGPSNRQGSGAPPSKRHDGKYGHGRNGLYLARRNDDASEEKRRRRGDRVDNVIPARTWRFRGVAAFGLQAPRFRYKNGLRCVVARRAFLPGNEPELDRGSAAGSGLARADVSHSTAHRGCRRGLPGQPCPGLIGSKDLANIGVS